MGDVTDDDHDMEYIPKRLVQNLQRGIRYTTKSEVGGDSGNSEGNRVSMVILHYSTDTHM